jgi:hypothetical protein
MRPFCQICNRKVAAINNKINGKTYYRTRCNSCIRKDKKLKPQIPNWKLAGYQQKKTCDRCGFSCKYKAQLIVYHVDGNLNNCDLLNLKTVCLNCTIEIAKLNLPWGRGGVLPDL